MDLSLTKIQRSWLTQIWGVDDNQKLGLACVNFEMPIRLPRGNVKKAVKDTTLEFPDTYSILIHEK